MRQARNDNAADSIKFDRLNALRSDNFQAHQRLKIGFGKESPSCNNAGIQAIAQWRQITGRLKQARWALRSFCAGDHFNNVSTNR